MNKLSPLLLCDFYKIGHIWQYPANTELIHATWTPRGSRMDGVDKVVAYGFQGFIKEYLIDYFNDNFFNRDLDNILEEYIDTIKNCLFIEDVDVSHITALHKLGYLPLQINALEEGTLVPMRVPMFTVQNTLPEFFWLTNALETLISTEVWPGITVATIAREYRTLLDKYAIETTGSSEGVQFQAHDFSMRGMSSVAHGAKAGGGHLLSFQGSDCIPAIHYLKNYYNGDMTMGNIGCSIPATEHSVQCANMPDNEDETSTIKRLITEVYPSGLVSIVMDTNDFWKNVTEVLPSLKDVIMKRDGKLVVRPDSGDPVDIVCGTHVVEDLDKEDYCKNLQNCQDWMAEGLEEETREETEHGEPGAESNTGYFSFEGKTYEITAHFFWNRHDKQFYYLEETEKIECKEAMLTSEQKGLIQVLYDIFGGTTTPQGYKLLDEHIGAIYGDSITLDRAEQICKRLKAKGFASLNIVFGVGSYGYNCVTRDTFCQAFKSTYAVINGKEKMLSKNPKTDDGTKKSQKGLVAVLDGPSGLFYTHKMLKKRYDEIEGNLLEVVFKDGVLVKECSLESIRNKMKED